MAGLDEPAPAIRPGEDMRSVGEAVSAIALARPNRTGWWIAFAGALTLVGLFALTLGYLVYAGVGIGHDDSALGGALDAASYDWWLGVACGSLLVAGILLLLGVEWRGPVNRIAETVALLATLTAGLYPILHLGWLLSGRWTLPGPNTAGLWPPVRPPLSFDTIDLVSFLVVALSLWYIGLLPDIACLRDRAFAEASRQQEEAAPTRRIALFRARAYGVFASGWRGSAARWQIRGQAYRIVALLGVLLVVAVQTGASVILAGSVLPGWHGTLMPISVLIHAVLSGVGVTAAVIVLVRAAFGFAGFVTERHLDVLSRLLLCLGCASAYCYAAEIFDTILAGEAAGRSVLTRRMTGGHAVTFWFAVLGLSLAPQVFWSAAARRSPLALALVGILAAAAAYADHVAVVLVTLAQDSLSLSRQASGVDLRGVATFAGSLGLFLALILLFVRYLPAVSITEIRRLVTTGGEAQAAPPPPRPAADQGAPLWGVAAAFPSEADLAAALQSLSLLGDRIRLDGFGPVPMPRTLRPLGLEGRSILPYALAGALGGGAAFYGVCVYATAYDDVVLIGGRPRLSWPSFVIPSVSFAMLCGCLAVHGALVWLNRLPRLNHPAFTIPGFRRATEDRFFLAAELRGDPTEAARIERRLAALPQGGGRPLTVARIPR